MRPRRPMWPGARDVPNGPRSRPRVASGAPGVPGLPGRVPRGTGRVPGPTGDASARFGWNARVHRAPRSVAGSTAALWRSTVSTMAGRPPPRRIGYTAPGATSAVRSSWTSDAQLIGSHPGSGVVGATLARGCADLVEQPLLFCRSRSGRRAGPADVRASAPAPRGAATGGLRRGRHSRGSAGTSMPRNDAGRVYCGYSRRPSAKDSICDRLLVDGARQQSDHRVDDHERRQLTAGQHVVADRQLEVHQRPDPLVDALVARAQEDEVRRRRQGRGTALAEPLADRVGQDHHAVRPARARPGRPRRARAAGPCRRRRRRCSRRRCDAARGPTPAGRGRGSPRGRAPDPAGDALGQRSLEHPREQREDVDLERISRRVGVGRRGRRRLGAPRAPRARTTRRRRRSRRSRAASRRDASVGPGAALRPAADSSASASTTISPRLRRKDPDERRRPAGRTRRTAHRGPGRPRAAGPVHVLDAAELARPRCRGRATPMTSCQ